MYDAGSRPDPGQQAAQAAAEKAVHNITGGADIEFSADGVRTMVKLLEDAKHRLQDTGYSDTMDTYNQPELDPVAAKYQPQSDKFQADHAKWNKDLLRAFDETIAHMHKIIKGYQDRDDDEARAFNGKID